MATRLKPKAAALYDQDFYVWTRDQAAATRAGRWVDLDVEHLAEEVEDLKSEQRAAVRSRVRTIIEHLLKLQVSPAEEPCHGWRRTFRTGRQGIRDRLATTIRNEIESDLQELYDDARANAVDSLLMFGEGEATTALLTTCPYTLEQILGDWLPDEPGRDD
ncbi:MAG: DUF29 domain-containing protein [Geminicoccaceae bacterium]|nr:DUF29 domain-containing protein [Geminicoccaceae bacterium]